MRDMQNGSTSGGADDPVSRALGDIPLPVYVTAQDVQFAARAVAVHAPEEWPAGTVCRNDRAAFPCRLHRWSRWVLAEHGLSDAEIDALARRGSGPVGGAARRAVGPVAAEAVPGASRVVGQVPPH